MSSVSCTFVDRIGRTVELEVFNDRSDRVYDRPDQGGEGRHWNEGEYVFKGRCRLNRDEVYGYVGYVSRITFEQDRNDAIRGMGEMLLHAMSKHRLEELTEKPKCGSAFHHGKHWGRCDLCGGFSESPRAVKR